MTSINTKHAYVSSADVVAVCVRRRGPSIVSKKLTTPNESAEFARAQMLQRKGIGGTTILTTNTNTPVVLPLTNRF